MAQRTNIVVESDLSGSPDAAPVAFGVDGYGYSIDLAPEEEETFRGLLAPYVGVARSTGKPRKSTRNVGGPAPAVVRAWALEHGFTLPPRGRIPAEVRAAYVAARQ